MEQDGQLNPITDRVTLYPWAQGETVVELQELLNAHGYRVKVDGDFGDHTESAVRAYQKQRGLRVNGVVDKNTWASLMQTVQPGTRLLRQGRCGADVYELQGLLRVNGYLVDRQGIFDPSTHQAIISFQTHYKLRPSGTVDRGTWLVLRGVPSLPPPAPRQQGWFWKNRSWW